MSLLGASLIKLAWRPAAIRTLMLLVGLVLVIYVLIGAMVLQEADPTLRTSVQQPLVFPGAMGSMAGLLVVFAGIAGAAFGGLVAGAEWNWNTYRVALTRGESRVRYALGLFIALALLALLAWVILYGFGIGVVVVAAAAVGVSSGSPLALPLEQHLLLLLAGWWAILVQLSLAFAISFITRSVVTGVATVMGLIMAELIGVAFIPIDLLQWAPFTAASSLVKIAGTSGLGQALALPLAATTGYIVVAMLAVGLVARRSEVI